MDKPNNISTEMTTLLTTNLLFIKMKEDGSIIWCPSAAESVYNLEAGVKDAQSIVCCGCSKPLRDIAQSEKWACYMKMYYCSMCFENSRSNVEEHILDANNSRKKIPHKMIDVQKSIENHHRFKTLNFLMKMEYEGSLIQSKSVSITRNNNKFIRDLWYHLYHNKEHPSSVYHK